MKICNVCGAKLEEDTVACPYCGERFTIYKEEKVQEENDERTIKYPYIKQRDILISLVLSILTLGFYSLYWFVKINDDLKVLTDDHKSPSGIVCIVLNIITLGIYGFFWAYRYGKKLDQISNNPSGYGHVICLVLKFFGLSVVNYCILQNAINEVIN